MIETTVVAEDPQADAAAAILQTCADQGWQVPSFRLMQFHAPSSRYCLIIPLINEGKRIHSLLQKIHSLGLDTRCDVILADGGSTDGSLTPDALSPYQICALITKTGPGKLSSQLRCAYAYALLQGYTGILTIDGNDKDEPDTIPHFIAGLEEGYDFLQASRFVRGGVGENTPLSRWIAIRLIHAPALSIASGFHWTDTTQGYRAYSRVMLLDPRVGIFRDIFRDYELLAYLSYRAPKLKYRCGELPTARRYPKGEATPTKIKGLSGNMRLLRTLRDTCFGRFNPS